MSFFSQNGGARRNAIHAGSWYNGNPLELSSEIGRWTSSEPPVERNAKVGTYSRIGLLRGYGNLQSYWTTAKLWKLTVVLATAKLKKLTVVLATANLKKLTVVLTYQAIIVPHAGYRFSGETASAAWSRLNLGPSIKRIVVIG